MLIDAANVHTIPRDDYFTTPWGDYLIKFDPDGHTVWDNIYKRNTSSFIRSKFLCSDKLGNLYYIGNFSGGQGVTFGALNVTPEGNDNIFVAKFNTDGTPQWLQKNSLPSLAIPSSATEDGKGNIYLTGLLSLGDIAFGSNTIALTTPIAGNPYASDIFIARLGNCSPTAPQLSPVGTKTLCKNESLQATASGTNQYVWSTHATTESVTLTTAGNYFAYGIDAMGCYAASDTLVVKTAAAETNVNQSAQTLIALATGASYQWVNCDASFAPIDQAIHQLFTVNESGSYAVIVTQNNCVDTSLCRTVTVTAIANANDAQELFTLYPNPGQGTYQLELTQGEGTAQLNDLTGKPIALNAVSTGVNALHYESLAAGVYLLSLTVEGKSFVQRLVVSR